MFYTIYKITNLINNKIYIGCHRTDDFPKWQGEGWLEGRKMKIF